MTTWVKCAAPTRTTWTKGLLGFKERSDGFMEVVSGDLTALVFSLRSDGFFSLDIPLRSRAVGNYLVTERSDGFLEFPLL